MNLKYICKEYEEKVGPDTYYTSIKIDTKKKSDISVELYKNSFENMLFSGDYKNFLDFCEIIDEIRINVKNQVNI